MARGYFETDGIRCLETEYPLSGDGPIHIGRAIGTGLAEVGDTALLAHDGRYSGDRIVDGLAEGLNQVGVHAELAGVLPTPGLAFLVREDKGIKLGIQTTASHNGPEFNGVKAFDQDGNKLPDDVEQGLNDKIVNGVPNRGRGYRGTRPGISELYKDFLATSAGGADFSGLRIGVDAANGAASEAAEVFARFGAQTILTANRPDGYNINVDCGAMHPESLQQTVVEHGLDIGVTLDGDADRLIMVDERGRQVTGDHVMYILAKANGYRGVVATQMTNLGTEIAMREAGIDLVREDVGDRYVLRGLQSTGYELGGEQSGHIILPHILATGDGMLAAIQTIRAVQESGMSLAEWRDQVTMLPQSLVNIPVANKSLLGHPDVEAYVQEVTAGLGGEGRVLIRPSGTEPLARVMIESPNADHDARLAAGGLQQLLAKLSA